MKTTGQVSCQNCSFCWPNIECWLGSFVIFQRIQTSIAKKPYIFVIFQGWGGGSRPPVSPSGSAHVITGVQFMGRVTGIHFMGRVALLNNVQWKSDVFAITVKPV